MIQPLAVKVQQACTSGIIEDNDVRNIIETTFLLSGFDSPNFDSWRKSASPSDIAEFVLVCWCLKTRRVIFRIPGEQPETFIMVDQLGQLDETSDRSQAKVFNLFDEEFARVEAELIEFSTDEEREQDWWLEFFDLLDETQRSKIKSDILHLMPIHRQRIQINESGEVYIQGENRGHHLDFINDLLFLHEAETERRQNFEFKLRLDYFERP